MLPGLSNPFFSEGSAFDYLGYVTGGNEDSTSHPITLPAGLQTGDTLLIVAAQATHIGPMSTPSGWTFLMRAGPSGAVNFNVRIMSWYRDIAGAPPTSVTLTTASASEIECVVLHYRPAGGAPVGAPFSLTTQSGSTLTAPNVDASSFSDGYLLRAYATANNAPIAAGLSGYDAVVENLQHNSTRRLSIYQKRLTTFGSQGTQTTTCSQSQAWNAGSLVVGLAA